MNQSNQPECECPSVDDLGEKVCGYVIWDQGGTEPATWESESYLLYYACTTPSVVDFEIMYDGPCAGM